MPTKYDSHYELYKTVNRKPMLIINQMSNEFTEVNIRKRFKSKYDSYCIFINFAITKVTSFESEESNIPINVYQNYFKIDSGGNFVVKTPL